MEFQNEYKRCPICKANVFKDMDTCYKCMHKFNEQNLDNVDLAVSGIHNQYKQEEILLGEFQAHENDMRHRKGNDSGTHALNNIYDEDPRNKGTLDKNMASFIEAMQTNNARLSQDGLFGLFLVEFERFLSGFIADHVVNL